jgi:hypothetical protein
MRVHFDLFHYVRDVRIGEGSIALDPHRTPIAVPDENRIVPTSSTRTQAHGEASNATLERPQVALEISAD